MQSKQLTLRTSTTFGILCIVAILSWFSGTSRADVGIVIYGSKGIDARRTDSGHTALIVTDLCARGIDQVRECVSGEPKGVVITKYPNLAAGYDQTVFVAPLNAHFYGVDDLQSVPVLTSGSTLRTLQMQYWRDDVKPFLPPLSSERYSALRKQESTFSVGRFFHRLITLDFLGKLFTAPHQHYSEDAIALLDPVTEDRIPNGSWREVIGTQYVRDSTTITVPAIMSEELQLAGFIERSQREPFNTLSNNCSDFAKQGLLTVFAGRGMRFRRRLFDPADAWITSPLLVATSFLEYAKKNTLPVSVSFTPVLAGTMRSASSVKAVSQGALIPSPDQGKVAFAVKLYINTLNPLIGTTTFAVVKASRFTNLDKLVHERSGSSLSLSTNNITGDLSDAEACRKSEQVRTFGTSSCWRRKREEFAAMTSQATEIGILGKGERSRLLAQGRPFLLPRFYEKLAEVDHQDAPFMQGVEACLSLGCAAGVRMGFLPLGAKESSREVPPSRLETRAMANSDEPADRLVAFRLMASVVNYDLASEPKNRRHSDVFDQDWQLFLDVAKRAGVLIAPEGAAKENLEQCSGREFREGNADRDAVQDAGTPSRRVFGFVRELVVSPTR